MVAEPLPQLTEAQALALLEQRPELAALVTPVESKYWQATPTAKQLAFLSTDCRELFRT